MSTIITEANLSRVTASDMHEAAKAALEKGSTLEFYSRSTKTGQPCQTLVVDEDTAGQWQGGATAWGDWDEKTKTILIGDVRINLDGEEVE